MIVAVSLLVTIVFLLALALLARQLARAGKFRSAPAQSQGWPTPGKEVQPATPAAPVDATPEAVVMTNRPLQQIDDCTRRLDARACRYNFAAVVKTTSGSSYNLSNVQTASRFPFPDRVKQQFGRLMVMATAPTNTGAQAVIPMYGHFWFSRLKELRNVGSRLEIVTGAGKTFRSEWGWLSNNRHKHYAHEYRDAHHEILVGLVDDQQVCLDSLDIEQVVFTTDEAEKRRFEADLEAVLPARQLAVFEFQKQRIRAEQFFLLDGAGFWFKTVFLHPWWPGGTNFTIWHDDRSGQANFWDFPRVEISKEEARKIQFGAGADPISLTVQLKGGKELSGYLVTHTESQRGAWQWHQGLRGFWDSVVVWTQEGLDVFDMFPDPVPPISGVDYGPLVSITFEGDQRPAKPK